MTVMGVKPYGGVRAYGSWSESLGPQQRVGEVKEEAERDETGERIVEDHGSPPLTTARRRRCSQSRLRKRPGLGRASGCPAWKCSLLRQRAQDNACSRRGELR